MKVKFVKRYELVEKGARHLCKFSTQAAVRNMPQGRQTVIRLCCSQAMYITVSGCLQK